MSIATFPDLKDASVVVTGGATGIGAALTEGFLNQGAKVAFLDIAESGAAFANEMAEATGNKPLFLNCNVTDVAALKEALAKAAAAHGPVTVLVNNAANDLRHNTLDVDEAYWDEMQAVNFKHHFFAIQAVIPGMQAAGGGSIINFSSISYMMGMGDYPGYTSAKSAITGLTRSMAREFGPDNIRCNAVMPGWVLTERQRELWAPPGAIDAFIAKQCLKREILPVDMVDPVLFLASGASTVMTGQALVVDAGVVVTG